MQVREAHRHSGAREGNNVRRHASANGFTLLEIAIVLAIVGALLTAGLRLVSVRADRALIDTTRSREDAIKSALIAYLARAKRLPCPDANLDGREDRAGAPCTSYVGTVPYLDLGLDRATVLDGWDNYFKFVVTPPAAVPAPAAASPPWKTTWLLKFSTAPASPAETSVAADAFWPSVSTGGVVVRDVAGNAIATAAVVPPTGAVAVLISHGRNGMGAVNIKGAQNDSTGVGSDEAKNINPLVAANQLEVVDREISDQDVNGRGAFDDLVMVIRREDLIAPLTANGVLRATADQALTQANDAIIGAAMATRSLSGGAPPLCTYKYTLPTSPYTFTGLASDWGVAYSYPAGGPATIQCNTSGPGVAYTLTAGDTQSRMVTFDEVNGMLGRAGGFN